MAVKVNIDQFIMDSRKREFFWNVYKRHKIAFLINRIQWYFYPKMMMIPKFPLHVDFEVSSLCNMKCPMCFRPHRINNEDGLMDFDLFRKGIDECVAHKLYSIRISWRGESTTHPKLIEMISFAKQKGIKEVSMLSNALVISKDYAMELVKAGLDYISISVDGLYEEYEEIRKPATFTGLLGRIDNLKILRDTIGGGYPRIKINTIWSKVAGRSDEYYSIFKDRSDLISFNPDYDYSETDSHVEPQFICQYPYQRVTVKWDGDVPMCISDWDGEISIGHLANDSIFDIWHGEKMNEIRNMHKDYNIRELNPCFKCHRPTTEQVGNQREVSDDRRVNFSSDSSS